MVKILKSVRGGIKIPVKRCSLFSEARFSISFRFSISLTLSEEESTASDLWVETVQNKSVPVFLGFSLLLRIYLIFSR